MITCPDLFSAAQTLVEAGNYLTSVAASDLSPLTNSVGTSISTFQLVAGGDAQLVVPASPSIDKNAIRLIVQGYTTYGGTSNSDFTLSVDGPSGSGVSSFSLGTTSSLVTVPFLSISYLAWDSVSQSLVMPNSSVINTGLSTQTSVLFYLRGQFARSVVTNNAVITRFELGLL